METNNERLHLHSHKTLACLLPKLFAGRHLRARLDAPCHRKRMVRRAKDPPEAAAFPGSGTPAPERRENWATTGSLHRSPARGSVAARQASKQGAQHETGNEPHAWQPPVPLSSRLTQSPGGRSGGAPFRLSPSTACWLSRFRKGPPRLPQSSHAVPVCAVMPAVISQLWGRPAGRAAAASVGARGSRRNLERGGRGGRPAMWAKVLTISSAVNRAGPSTFPSSTLTVVKDACYELMTGPCSKDRALFFYQRNNFPNFAVTIP